MTFPRGEFGVDFIGEEYEVGFLKGDWTNGEIGDVIAEVWLCEETGDAWSGDDTKVFQSKFDADDAPDLNVDGSILIFIL